MARLRNSFSVDQIQAGLIAVIDADAQVSKDNMLKGRIRDLDLGDKTVDLRFDIRGDGLNSDDPADITVTSIVLAAKGESFSLSGVSLNGANVTDAINSGDFEQLEDLVLGGNDFVQGGSGSQSLSGFGGNDKIFGKGGADEIFGGDGDDLVRAGGGADTVDGGAGADRLFGAGGADEIFGGSENDKIKGQGGRDLLFGGDGDDTLDGNGGADELSGDTGADILRGRGGADILSGGEGIDTLIGGGGADTFVFGDEVDGDEIRGFNGNVDLIDFVSSTSVTEFADLTIVDSVDGAEVSSAAGLIVVLSGIAAIDVAEDDFIFA